MTPQEALNQLDAVAATVKYTREDHATLQSCTMVLQQVINQHAAFVQQAADQQAAADQAAANAAQSEEDKAATKKAERAAKRREQRAKAKASA